MPTVEVNTPPYYGQLTIYQGRPFSAVTVKLADSEGTPIAIDVQGHLCDQPVAQGGSLVATCEAVGPDDDEGWRLELSSAETRALENRDLILEAMYKRSGEEWETAALFQVTVVPEHTLPVVSLEVTGDLTISVGQITSLTATATYDDDSTEDVTEWCTWTPNPNGHATIPYGMGYVHGANAGTTGVVAALGSVTDAVSVVVS